MKKERRIITQRALKLGLVVGVAHSSICSRFIAEQSRNPSHTMISLKIEILKCTLYVFHQF